MEEHWETPDFDSLLSVDEVFVHDNVSDTSTTTESVTVGSSTTSSYSHEHTLYQEKVEDFSMYLDTLSQESNLPEV